MININYSPKFLKIYKKIVESDLKKEIKTKIELFRNEKNHKNLDVHKLKKVKRDTYSFSVNYKDRILFRYLNKKEVVLLIFGDHDIYKNL
jgi:plasmid maintenance system killer protein